MDPTAITMGLKWSRTLPLSRYIEAIYSPTNWPLSVSARTQGHMGGQSADKVSVGWVGGRTLLRYMKKQSVDKPSWDYWFVNETEGGIIYFIFLAE